MPTPTHDEMYPAELIRTIGPDAFTWYKNARALSYLIAIKEELSGEVVSEPYETTENRVALGKVPLKKTLTPGTKYIFVVITKYAGEGGAFEMSNPAERKFGITEPAPQPAPSPSVDEIEAFMAQLTITKKAIDAIPHSGLPTQDQLANFNRLSKEYREQCEKLKASHSTHPKLQAAESLLTTMEIRVTAWVSFTSREMVLVWEQLKSARELLIKLGLEPGKPGAQFAPEFERITASIAARKSQLTMEDVMNFVNRVAPFLDRVRHKAREANIPGTNNSTPPPQPKDGDKPKDKPPTADAPKETPPPTDTDSASKPKTDSEKPADKKEEAPADSAEAGNEETTEETGTEAAQSEPWTTQQVIVMVLLAAVVVGLGVWFLGGWLKSGKSNVTAQVPAPTATSAPAPQITGPTPEEYEAQRKSFPPLNRTSRPETVTETTVPVTTRSEPAPAGAPAQTTNVPSIYPESWKPTKKVVVGTDLPANATADLEIEAGEVLEIVRPDTSLRVEWDPQPNLLDLVGDDKGFVGNSRSPQPSTRVGSLRILLKSSSGIAKTKIFIVPARR